MDGNDATLHPFGIRPSLMQTVDPLESLLPVNFVVGFEQESSYLDILLGRVKINRQGWTVLVHGQRCTVENVPLEPLNINLDEVRRWNRLLRHETVYGYAPYCYVGSHIRGYRNVTCPFMVTFDVP